MRGCGGAGGRGAEGQGELGSGGSGCRGERRNREAGESGKKGHGELGWRAAGGERIGRSLAPSPRGEVRTCDPVNHNITGVSICNLLQAIFTLRVLNMPIDNVEISLYILFNRREFLCRLSAYYHDGHCRPGSRESACALDSAILGRRG